MTKPPAQFPLHVRSLLANLDNVERLAQIHADVTAPGPGRKRNVEVLNKSALVLLVACWEAYVEDLAEAALDKMIRYSRDHSHFPESVLERIASKCQGPKAWKLAGDGWKTEARNNLTEVLHRTTGALNTPKANQIDELFLKTLGLRGLSAHWRWRQVTARQARDKLDGLVVLRGSIAHRVETSAPVHKRTVTDYHFFISRLATLTHNAVGEHLFEVLGREVWGKMSVKRGRR